MTSEPIPADDADDEGPFVCDGCIAETILTREIEREGTVRECDYCDQADRPCVTIEWLAERIDPVYREVVVTADEVPHVTAHDNVHWIPKGDPPGEVMAGLIECADEKIADDIVAHLAKQHSWEIYEGDFDWYDDTSDIYALRLPTDPRYREAWRAFCQSLKHNRRFFSEDATEKLDEILGPVLAGGSSQFGVAIRTIGPESDDRFIYRARLANDEAARRAIYASPLNQLGPPPKTSCGAGRMNVAGIPVFYGSFDIETCVAEIRPPVGGSAVVGKFEIIRPLRLLDLSQLERVQNELSYFHPDFLRDHGYGQFVSGFHEEIKKPVLPGTEALEYLPTQVVAEYLWTRKDRGVDGIIFGSSQVSGNHANIVLFPEAGQIEGADKELPRSIAESYVISGNPDEDELPVENVYVRESEKQPPSSTMAWPQMPGQRKAAKPPAALRMSNDLIRAQVTAISFKVNEIPITFDTHDPNPPF